MLVPYEKGPNFSLYEKGPSSYPKTGPALQKGKGIPQTYFITGIVSQGECSFEHLKIYPGLLACFKLVAEIQHRSFGWHLLIS